MPPRLKSVMLSPEEVVNVAFACRDRLVGAKKVVAVVFSDPFKKRVLLEKSSVPPVGAPFNVILPLVLEISPALIVKPLLSARSWIPVIIFSSV